MTREEAINHLKTVAKTAIDSGYDGAVVDAVDMAREALEQEPSWIPVSERLPENESRVLVTIQTQTRSKVRSGMFDNKRFYNDNGDTWKATDKEVKAWMPLPQPYRAESEDKCKKCEYYRNPDYTRCHECKSESEDKE